MLENTVIFTIDKTAKICGSALDYITFLKGAVPHEINTDSCRHYLQNTA